MKEENQELRIIHKVSEGETIEDIAFMYETTSEKIKDLNNLESLDNYVGEEIIASEFPTYYLSQGNYHNSYGPSSGESELKEYEVVLPIDAPEFVRVPVESGDGICFHRTDRQGPLEEIRKDYSGDFPSCEACEPTPTITETPTPTITETPTSTPTPMTPTTTVTMTCRWTQTLLEFLNETQNTTASDFETLTNHNGSRLITHDSTATDSTSITCVIYDIDSSSGTLKYTKNKVFENYLCKSLSYKGDVFCYEDKSTNKVGAKKYNPVSGEWENLFDEIDSPYIEMSYDGKTFVYFKTSDYDPAFKVSSKLQIKRFEPKSDVITENDYELDRKTELESVFLSFDGDTIFLSHGGSTSLLSYVFSSTSAVFEYVLKSTRFKTQSKSGNLSLDGKTYAVATDTNFSVARSEFHSRTTTSQTSTEETFSYPQRNNSAFPESPPSKLSINFAGLNSNTVMSCDGRMGTNPMLFGPGFLTVYNYIEETWVPEPCSWQGTENLQSFGQLGSFNMHGDIYFALTGDSLSAFSFQADLKNLIESRGQANQSFSVSASKYSTGGFTGVQISGSHRGGSISSNFNNDKEGLIVIESGDTLSITNDVDLSNSKIYISKDLNVSKLVSNSSNQGAIKGASVEWTPDGSDTPEDFKNFFYYVVKSDDATTNIAYGKIIVV